MSILQIGYVIRIDLNQGLNNTPIFLGSTEKNRNILRECLESNLSNLSDLDMITFNIIGQSDDIYICSDWIDACYLSDLINQHSKYRAYAQAFLNSYNAPLTANNLIN